MIDRRMLWKHELHLTDNGTMMSANSFLIQRHVYLGNVIECNVDFHILSTTDGIDKQIRVSLYIVIHLLEQTCHKLSTSRL